MNFQDYKTINETFDFQFPLRISSKDLKRLSKECKKHKINRSQFVRFLIKKYFDDANKK